VETLSLQRFGFRDGLTTMLAGAQREGHTNDLLGEIGVSNVEVAAVEHV
jgi:hypothetical protein